MSLTEDIETEALMVPGLFWQSLVVLPDWHADALCREYPEVTFFPGKGEQTGPAKAICARCLVRDEYLSTAMEGVTFGVWGGTSDRDRQALRRRQAAA